MHAPTGHGAGKSPATPVFARRRAHAGVAKAAAAAVVGILALLPTAASGLGSGTSSLTPHVKGAHVNAPPTTKGLGSSPAGSQILQQFAPGRGRDHGPVAVFM